MEFLYDIQLDNGAKYKARGDDSLTLKSGDWCVIRKDFFLDYGQVVSSCRCPYNPAEEPKENLHPTGTPSEKRAEIPRIQRKATVVDQGKANENLMRSKSAMRTAAQYIEKLGLPMKLINAHYSFDNKLLAIQFSADGRVDFRELVKDLASVFRTRIELRQIGVRDKAKMVGGLGVCGRPFCCKEFLDDFQPVSIKMAKTQNLSLNPTKISGTCGRLMCCLKYEQEAYEDLIKTAPKVESFVDTADGRGTVIEVNLLRQSVRVRMEDHPETIGTYKNTDIYILRSGKARKNDPPIPRDFAPISSKPRPVQKKEAFFEELPEVIYPDAVAVIAPETQAAEEETGDAAEEAGKNANRRRRRGGRRTKPAGERPQEAAVPEKTAPKEQLRADAPRRERPKKERPPQQDKPERKPAPQKQERPEKAEASSSDGQPKPRRRRRRSGGPRKPSGEGQTPKAE